MLSAVNISTEVRIVIIVKAANISEQTACYQLLKCHKSMFLAAKVLQQCVISCLSVKTACYQLLK